MSTPEVLRESYLPTLTQAGLSTTRVTVEAGPLPVPDWCPWCTEDIGRCECVASKKSWGYR